MFIVECLNYKEQVQVVGVYTTRKKALSALKVYEAYKGSNYYCRLNSQTLDEVDCEALDYYINYFAKRDDNGVCQNEVEVS